MSSKGIDLSAYLSPWLRFCIGLAILFTSVTPLLVVIRWW